MPFKVEVVTQERKLFEDDAVDMVLVPGSDGELGILPRHTPLLTTMKLGELIIRKGRAEESFVIYGGVVEVRPDRVSVLADSADFTADISLDEALEARERAQAMLGEEVSEEERKAYLESLRNAELAIKIARKTKSGAGSVRIVSKADSGSEQ
jgi:F-type H+-transporting ATPase subunit epsilon